MDVVYNPSTKEYPPQESGHTETNPLEMARHLTKHTGLNLQDACTHVLDAKCAATGEAPIHRPKE